MSTRCTQVTRQLVGRRGILSYLVTIPVIDIVGRDESQGFADIILGDKAAEGISNTGICDIHSHFVSYVPVHVNLPLILVADIVAYLAMMAMLLLTVKFISRVDPALTVKAD